MSDQIAAVIYATDPATGNVYPVQVTSSGLFVAGNYGWINGAWQKDPLAFGYSGDQSEIVINQNAAAGSNILNGATVPAGEIWYVQAIHALNNVSNPTSIFLFAVVNGQSIYLASGTTPGIGFPVMWSGQITLSEGDKIQTVINGCTLNDDIYLGYHGVRVDIDQ